MQSCTYLHGRWPIAITANPMEMPTAYSPTARRRLQPRPQHHPHAPPHGQRRRPPRTVNLPPVSRPNPLTIQPHSLQTPPQTSPLAPSHITTKPPLRPHRPARHDHDTRVAILPFSILNRPSSILHPSAPIPGSMLLLRALRVLSG